LEPTLGGRKGVGLSATDRYRSASFDELSASTPLRAQCTVHASAPNRRRSAVAMELPQRIRAGSMAEYAKPPPVRVIGQYVFVGSAPVGGEAATTCDTASALRDHAGPRSTLVRPGRRQAQPGITGPTLARRRGMHEPRSCVGATPFPCSRLLRRGEARRSEVCGPADGRVGR
jgi:hypothetical protein